MTAALPGWQLWVSDRLAPVGERNTRSIPQDGEIAVAARDGGRRRQCGSASDLHCWALAWLGRLRLPAYG